MVAILWREDRYRLEKAFFPQAARPVPDSGKE